VELADAQGCFGWARARWWVSEFDLLPEGVQMLNTDAEGAMSGGSGKRLFIGGSHEVNGLALQACDAVGAVFRYEEGAET
jgi:hypothetical protein